MGKPQWFAHFLLVFLGDVKITLGIRHHGVCPREGAVTVVRAGAARYGSLRWVESEL